MKPTLKDMGRKKLRTTKSQRFKDKVTRSLNKKIRRGKIKDKLKDKLKTSKKRIKKLKNASKTKKKPKKEKASKMKKPKMKKPKMKKPKTKKPKMKKPKMEKSKKFRIRSGTVSNRRGSGISMPSRRSSSGSSGAGTALAAAAGLGVLALGATALLTGEDVDPDHHHHHEHLPEPCEGQFSDCDDNCTKEWQGTGDCPLNDGDIVPCVTGVMGVSECCELGVPPDHDCDGLSDELENDFHNTSGDNFITDCDDTEHADACLRNDSMFDPNDNDAGLTDLEGGICQRLQEFSFPAPYDPDVGYPMNPPGGHLKCDEDGNPEAYFPSDGGDEISLNESGADLETVRQTIIDSEGGDPSDDPFQGSYFGPVQHDIESGSTDIYGTSVVYGDDFSDDEQIRQRENLLTGETICPPDASPIYCEQLARASSWSSQTGDGIGWQGAHERGDTIELTEQQQDWLAAHPNGQ